MSIKTNKNNKLLTIAGPSGAGKTTVCNHLLKEFKELIAQSVSATTRPMRSNEQNGIDYYFLTDKEYSTKLDEGGILDHKILHNYQFGTMVSTLEDILKDKKVPLMNKNVQGSIFMRKYFDVFTIFIAPPSLEVLEERIRNRGENDEDSIKIQLAEAIKEIDRRHNCDVIIVNDNLETTLAKVTKAVQKFLGGGYNESNNQ